MFFINIAIIIIIIIIIIIEYFAPVNVFWALLNNTSDKPLSLEAVLSLVHELFRVWLIIAHLQ